MLEARHLSVTFAGGFLAVDRVDVDVRPGEVLTLCGPNGAGKSTVFSVLAGDRAASSGTVTIDGEKLSSLSAQALSRRRAVLEQTPKLSAPFSVAALAGLSIGIDVPPSKAKEIVRQSLEATGLSVIAEKRADMLSGGERHRAHLARVLSQLAATGEQGGMYLLLDEPTASLDIEHQIAVMRIARKAAKAGVGVLVILHDLTLAAVYSHRVGLMHKGRMVAIGPPREVFTSAALSEVYRTPIDVGADACGHMRITPAFDPRAA